MPRFGTALPLALFASHLFAQTPTAGPSFEAASIRLNNSSNPAGLGYQFLPGGRLTITKLPLFMIVSLAYDLPYQSPRLSGGPDWIKAEKYDIEAAAPAGAVPAGISSKERDEKIRLMLQHLLADRFKLVMRRETREAPVYAVVVGKLGPKLQKSRIEEKDCPSVDAGIFSGTSCHSIIGGMGRGIHGKAISVSDIVTFTENWSDRPMVNQTGIEGLFEVDTDGWAPMLPRIIPPGREPTAEDIAMSDPTRPTLGLIFERLGLKMEARRAPVDWFVIESVEHPTPN